MTTQEVAPAAPARTYSELIRGEIKAECARRDINQRALAALMGISQQAVSDRWRGRTPWALDEVERLESVLGLTRGALFGAVVRPEGFEPPTFWFGADTVLTSADVDALELDDEDEYRRGGCVVCSGDCEPGRCIMFDDLVRVDAVELAA